MNELVSIKGMTKDYGEKRGIFDINLSVNKGEVFGIVGINGSGKTTIIRHLMGFLKPNDGKCFIKRKNCWSHAAELKKSIGYIPGEIAFPDVQTGEDFFKWEAEFLGLKDLSYAYELAERFQLDAKANLKRMSKGMKQKTAIVSAFMADPEILLLDEATTGLDPLMQTAFSDLILEEKKKGKTIFMSSHMFNELETTCDRVAFLKNGHITQVVNIKNILGNEKIKTYKIEFKHPEQFQKFLKMDFQVKRIQREINQVTIQLADQDLGRLLQILSNMKVNYISQKPDTLETYFKEKYNESEVA